MDKQYITNLVKQMPNVRCLIRKKFRVFDKFGDEQKEIVKTIKEFFNEERQRITTDYFDKDSETLVGKDIYKYEDEKLIDKTKYDENGEIVFKDIYNYDLKAIYKQQKYSYNKFGQLKDTFVYVYDMNNHILEGKFQYGSSGGIDYECRYQYDEKRNLIKKEDLKTKIVFNLKYCIDSDKLQELELRSNNNEFFKYKYFYDASGKLTEKGKYQKVNKFGDTFFELISWYTYDYELF